VLCGNEDILLVELWILAEKFLIRGLQNYTMDVMLTKQVTCGGLAMRCYQYLYDNTGEGSALRSFVVEQRCWLGSKMCNADEKMFPREMLRDMVIFLQEQVHARERKERGDKMGEDRERFLVKEDPGMGQDDGNVV